MKKTCAKRIKRGVGLVGLLMSVAIASFVIGEKKEAKDTKNAKFLVSTFVDQDGVILLPEKEEIISNKMQQCSGEKVAKEIYEQGVNCLIIGNTIFTETSKLVSKVTFHVSREEAIVAEEMLTEKGYYIFLPKEGYTLHGAYNIRYVDDYVTLYTDFDPNGEYSDVKIRRCKIIEIMDVETRRSHPFEELYDYNFLWEESENKENGFSFQLVPKERKED